MRKHAIKQLSVLLLFCLITTAGFAQNRSIHGSVTNAKTHKPMPGVNVFLDQTTIGTTTGKNGHYRLRDLPKGTYNLVFSFTGFKAVKKTIRIPRTYDAPIAVSLEPSNVVMDSLVVKDKRPDKWLKNLRRFKKAFLGPTHNADLTTIVNPEVLQFNTKNGDLLAHSSKPLHLKNNALGYDITVHLRSFNMLDTHLRTRATTQFSAMKPSSAQQRQRWKRARERTYRGSFRHFIHAMVQGKLYEQGFRLLFTEKRRIYPLNNQRPDPTLTHTKGNKDKNDQIIVKPNQIHKYWNYRKLGQIRMTTKRGYNYWKVVYMREHPEEGVARKMDLYKLHHVSSMHQVSFIKLPQGSGLVDTRTALGIPPHLPVTYGYWGWSSSIPEWLPKNYNPISN